MPSSRYTFPIPGLTPLWSTGEAPRRVSERRPGDCPVHLAWVLVGRRLATVSEFAPLEPRLRPAAICPVCREAVVLKLGARRAHHAAHRAGSRCPVLYGETALHLNAKCHLARELERSAGSTLRVLMRCGERTTDESGRAGRCAASREIEWTAGWNGVALELALDGTRPDVALLDGDRIVAAIEVAGTNPVSAEKERRLAALGISWIEVRAHRELYGGLVPWTIDAPLHARRLAHAGAAGGAWRCAAHARRAERLQRARENGWRSWRARIVDRYLPGGTCERDVLHLEAELRGGRVAAVRLLHTLDDEVIAKSIARTREAALRELHSAFLRWARARADAGERLDSPMPWVPAARLRRRIGEWRCDPVHFPRRYRFVRDGAGPAGRWERITGVASDGWARPGR